MSSVDLLDCAQEVLSSWTAAPLHASTLRADLVAREQGQTENLTTHTQGSDAFYVDPDDLSRLEGDLREFKSYFSQVKFSWMESNVKRRFVQRVLVENPTAPQLSEVRAADEACAEKKAELQQHKARVEQLGTSIASVAELLDSELTSTNEHAEQVRALARSVRGLELDLAVLRNNQPPADQRMTAHEAEAILQKQTQDMAAISAAVMHAKKRIAEKKAALAAAKRDVEHLEQERALAERGASEAEKASQAGDAGLANACRWYTTTKVLLSKLVGIRDVTVLGNPPTEIECRYVVPKATLRLRFGPAGAAGQGALIGAQVLDQKIDISDLLEAHLPRNNVPGLVQDVLARIACQTEA